METKGKKGKTIKAMFVDYMMFLSKFNNYWNKQCLRYLYLMQVLSIDVLNLKWYKEPRH